MVISFTMNATGQEVCTVSLVRAKIECVDTTDNVFNNVTDITMTTN